MRSLACDGTTGWNFNRREKLKALRWPWIVGKTPKASWFSSCGIIGQRAHFQMEGLKIGWSIITVCNFTWNAAVWTNPKLQFSYYNWSQLEICTRHLALLLDEFLKLTVLNVGKKLEIFSSGEWSLQRAWRRCSITLCRCIGTLTLCFVLWCYVIYWTLISLPSVTMYSVVSIYCNIIATSLQ